MANLNLQTRVDAVRYSPEALTYEQAGEYMGISKKSIQRMVDKGILPRVLLGPTETSTRILRRDCDDYLERQAANQRGDMREVRYG